MGRFQRSERGGQVDPAEALRRAREAVTRERVHRDEDRASDADAPTGSGEGLEPVEEALRAQRERDDADEG
jgi:hypothetical protein